MLQTTALPTGHADLVTGTPTSQLYTFAPYHANSESLLSIDVAYDFYGERSEHGCSWEIGAEFIQADAVWYQWMISRNGLSGSKDQGLAKGQ